MENIEYPKINPEKITKPIQLLAVWFIGLIFIDGLFIFSAIKINHIVLEFFLIIASILNVPLFLYLLFKLQTKFRAELQEDSYYAKYLDKNLKMNENKTLDERVEFRNEIENQFIAIDKKLDNINIRIKEPELGNDIGEIKKDYENILNMISHNLKSSQQAIKSGAQLLENMFTHGNVPLDKVLSIIERIQTNALLNEITLDNLLFQNTDRIFIEDNISFNKDIMIPVLRILKPIAFHKNVKINIETSNLPKFIQCDKNAIKIAFYNALENAIKYSPESKEIVINFQVQDKFLIVKIVNESKKISENEIKNIFEYGFRGKDSIDHIGTGIGLYTANQILKKHKGIIEVRFENELFITKIQIPFIL